MDQQTVEVETIAFDQQVQQWMQANLPPQMRSQGSGLSVMLASAMRTYINRFGAAPGRRIRKRA